MYYDMDYYGVLMSKIGGGSGWNNYGYGSTMKTGGRQTLTKGQAVKQASYADKNNIKSALGSSGSFGQKVGSNAGSVETAAANAERYGTGSVLGNTGYYGNSGLYGLLGNYYGLAGGYGSSFGLSSYLNNWFA